MWFISLLFPLKLHRRSKIKQQQIIYKLYFEEVIDTKNRRTYHIYKIVLKSRNVTILKLNLESVFLRLSLSVLWLVYVDFGVPRTYFSNFISGEIDDDRVAPNSLT